jgi:hypothetical protein
VWEGGSVAEYSDGAEDAKQHAKWWQGVVGGDGSSQCTHASEEASGLPTTHTSGLASTRRAELRMLAAALVSPIKSYLHPHHNHTREACTTRSSTKPQREHSQGDEVTVTESPICWRGPLPRAKHVQQCCSVPGPHIRGLVHQGVGPIKALPGLAATHTAPATASNAQSHTTSRSHINTVPRTDTYVVQQTVPTPRKRPHLHSSFQPSSH